MKHRKKAIFAIIILVVLLAACGIRSDKGVTSGEMVAPEVSSEDLLVSSLEYLLLYDNEEEKTDHGSNSSDQDEKIKNAAEGAEDSIQPEKDVQSEEAVIYYGDGGSVALKQETIELKAVTPDELIGALSRHNIVSLDTKVLSFEQRDAVLYLDLSKAAGEYLRTMSKEAECIIVAAVVNTFLGNYDADAIYIMVEGEALVTSNAEYTEALELCTPAELLEKLKTPDTENNKTGVTNNSAGEVQRKLPLVAEKE